MVRTLVDGYDAVLAHPQAGETALTSQVSGLSAKAVSQQLKVELPAFLPKGGGGYGSLEPAVLRAWARWEKKFGIVKTDPGRRRDLQPIVPPQVVPRSLRAWPGRTQGAMRTSSTCETEAPLSAPY